MQSRRGRIVGNWGTGRRGDGGIATSHFPGHAAKKWKKAAGTTRNDTTGRRHRHFGCSYTLLTWRMLCCCERWQHTADNKSFVERQACNKHISAHHLWTVINECADPSTQGLKMLITRVVSSAGNTGQWKYLQACTAGSKFVPKSIPMDTQKDGATTWESRSIGMHQRLKERELIKGSAQFKQLLDVWKT